MAIYVLGYYGINTKDDLLEAFKDYKTNLRDRTYLKYDYLDVRNFILRSLYVLKVKK